MSFPSQTRERDRQYRPPQDGNQNGRQHQNHNRNNDKNNNQNNNQSYNNNNTSNPTRHFNTLPTQSNSTVEIETDPKILQSRQDGIAHVKTSSGYESYLLAVPKNQRDKSKKHANHPITPPFTHKLSKRRYKGYFDQWVGLLHGWDNNKQGYDSLNDMKAGRINNLIKTAGNDDDGGNGNGNDEDKDFNSFSFDRSGSKNVRDEVEEDEDEALAAALRLAEQL
jgi:hypothetical protein